MAKVAKFDFSVADAYIAKAVGPTTAYTITFDIYIPAATLSTPPPGFGFADFIELGSIATPSHGVGFVNDPPWRWSCDDAPDAATGPGADTWVPCSVHVFNPSGTSWDIDWTIDGSLLFSLTGMTLPNDQTQTLLLNLGAMYSYNTSSQIVLIRNVIVKDAASATIFSDDFSSGGFSSGGWTVVGSASVIDFPPPAPINIRFFEGFAWRYIVTDLNTETITFLDRLATGRQVHVGRNQPREMSGAVPSDNPEINILHTDGDPFLSEGNRLLYAFRREGAFGPGPTWVCRGAGPILFTDDAAQTDQPLTRFNAWDPWKLAYRRPLRLANGDLPGPAGRVFLAADTWTYQQIAKRLLTDSILYDGTLFIDPDGGTVVDGDPIVQDLTLQQGQSLGDCWDVLCATGNIDIVLEPVYEPVGSPGICVTFNAKPRIGVVQNAAIFAWDLPSRSLVDISKAKDGTGRANTIQYYFGQGGPAVSQQIDAASLAKYGEYWEQQFWPGFKQAGPVSALAARRLQLVRDGIKTYTFGPAPERSPIPLLEYNPGDWCPFYASKKLREPLNPVLVSGVWRNIPRIEALTLDIADNQTETVSELLTSLEVQPV